MPSWGILRSKKKDRAARKVHFNLGQDEDNRSRSSSLLSDASNQHLQVLGQGAPPKTGSGQNHPNLSHKEVEDEEERQCLRHLDRLSLTLENTFKEVETIDAYVKKLQYQFNHEMLLEKRYMSCMCSAKIARAACCKKQIEVWQQWHHDIQESRCHHHNHRHNDSLTGESSDHTSSDNDTSSVSTSSSQDVTEADVTKDITGTDVIVSHLNKMVLFDVVRARLDPSADSRTFVDHWILNGQLSADSANNNLHHTGVSHAQL
ncbi:hypothetical protein ACOMHN_033747 [Nucella lapillus]